VFRYAANVHNGAVTRLHEHASTELSGFESATPGRTPTASLTTFLGYIASRKFASRNQQVTCYLGVTYHWSQRLGLSRHCVL